MKKMYLIRSIIFMIVLIAIIGGCCKENEILSISDTIPYEKGKYYEIYDITKYKYGYPQYQYFIFDSNDNVLDYDVINREPKISQINALVKFCIGIGTGVRNCRYYDPEKKLISEWFENPITESDTMVVHMDYVGDVYQLIIQDIFDKHMYYKGFIRDFSHVVYPVTDAEFINNGKQLRITYKSGEDEHEVTETLDLYPAQE